MSSPTEEEIKRKALGFARNAWRRYKAYCVRYMKKYGGTSRPPRPEAYFNNRLLEDGYAMIGGGNPLPNGKHMEARQILSDSLLTFRAQLGDTSVFDMYYAGSLARRMPGYEVTIKRAMSASEKDPEKESIRTFVKKIR